MSKQSTGKHAEALAKAYLEQRGHTFIAANWRCRLGEIDLITRQGDMLVFTEVRARRADNTAEAAASIGSHKRQKMIRAAQLYLSQHDIAEAVWRIDLVVVALPPGGQPILEHMEDALDW